MTTPKLTMNETTTVVEAILNCSDPIRGTTVRSNPTMPPTKALMRIRRENWRQFSRRPRRMDAGVGVSGREVMSMAPVILHCDRT